MFRGATNFNQPLNNWDVSKVTDMGAMFAVATNFNQSLDNWDVSKVTIMESMFYHATNFNQPLTNWDVSKVLGWTNMFDGSGMSESNATWYFVDGDSDSTLSDVGESAWEIINTYE